MRLTEISMCQVKLPLTKPYRVSFRTYTDLEPILIEMRGDNDTVGWGEAYIPAGSTAETTESGWQFCREQGHALLGKTTTDAKSILDRAVPVAPFAATAMLTALAMLERHPILNIVEETRIPLLVPVSGKTDPEIKDEVERLLAIGYRTLKIKVGWDVDDDLARVSSVQKAVRGRAEIIMDANRGYDQAQGCRFASSLDPESIALFEQPCGADAWDANAAVARVSPVPLMLDESITTIDDIDRAATVPGVKFVKLKLKRIGGIDRAVSAMERARQAGLEICLGDGVATELLCWVEACVGRKFLHRAGDMNGFLKPVTRLFKEPLQFDRGSIVLKPAFWPTLDAKAVKAHELRRERFAPAAVS